jgi:hypothetical protein
MRMKRRRKIEDADQWVMENLLMRDLQLGTFGRAKRKVDELQGVIAKSRTAGAH